MSWEDILKEEDSEFTDWSHNPRQHSFRIKEVPREKLPLDAPLAKKTLRKIQEACALLVGSFILGPKEYDKIKDMQLTIERIEHESAHSKKPLTEETIGQPDE
tara:strand:+ start:1141 stop:1449 length:309 start_codon:yes stop_codon:yes gene_type:complete